MNSVNYSFTKISNCNFCGADESSFKLLGRRLNKAQGKFPNKLDGVTTSIKKCKKCDLIFSDPMPLPLDFDDHYGIEPNKFWPDSYFKVDDDSFAKELKSLREISNVKFENMRALDIGAGIGKSMISMEKMGISAWGIEPSSSFFKMAIEKMHIHSSRLSNLGIENADFDSSFFDFITFGAVLEHLPDPSQSIVKAMKWLKKGGLIQIEVPSSNWFVSRLGNFYYKLFNTGFASNISPMHSPFHLYEFTNKTFEIHGRMNGYEVAFCEYHVCTTYLPKILDPIVIPYMEKTNSGMQLEIWLRKL